MTTQEMFDRAVMGVFVQGGPSRNDPACKYRDGNECKCAVGHLINDEAYSPSLEGIPSNEVEVIRAVEKNWIGIRFN